jgi:GTP cyclohydrolase I
VNQNYYLNVQIIENMIFIHLKDGKKVLEKNFIEEHIMSDNECLPDIQCTTPALQTAIKQVGVENVEVPFTLESKYGGFHQLTANVTMMTSLDKTTKGISMSRLLLTLKPYLDLPLKSILIRKIIEKMLENVGGTSAFMRFEFRLPRKRKSIKTLNEFPIYYKCKFEGQIHIRHDESLIDPVPDEYHFRFFQGVTVQYASYCPCSAELCNVLDGGGFPHNQRSFAHILTEVDTESHYVWLEDIIDAVENNINTLPYPIIKRIDEQEIARVAAENPMFVEDAIRIISDSIDNIPGIIDWIIKCIHEESIHTSEAIAVNWKGTPQGFDGRRYI